jgi:hydrogenase maturation protease
MAGYRENMTLMDHPNRKVVLGLGNLLFSDEGFGIQAVQILHAQHGSQFPVEWIDGGVLGLNLLPLVEECSHLLVLDAVDAEQPGGTLVEMRRDEIPLYSGVKMSEHQVGFQEVLGMAKFRGRYPTHLYLVGVQPADLSVSVRLSPAVTAALPATVQRATAILWEWFPA